MAVPTVALAKQSVKFGTACRRIKLWRAAFAFRKKAFTVFKKSFHLKTDRAS